MSLSRKAKIQIIFNAAIVIPCLMLIMHSWKQCAKQISVKCDHYNMNYINIYVNPTHALHRNSWRWLINWTHQIILIRTSWLVLSFDIDSRQIIFLTSGIVLLTSAILIQRKAGLPLRQPKYIISHLLILMRCKIPVKLFYNPVWTCLLL